MSNPDAGVGHGYPEAFRGLEGRMGTLEGQMEQALKILNRIAGATCDGQRQAPQPLGRAPKEKKKVRRGFRLATMQQRVSRGCGSGPVTLSLSYANAPHSHYSPVAGVFCAL